MNEHDEDPYCIVIGPHIPEDGRAVFALACEHATVSTEDVERRFTPEYALGLYLLVASAEPGSLDVISAIVMRLLLGWTLAERAGCSCHERGFRVIESDGGVRVEDVG